MEFQKLCVLVFFGCMLCWTFGDAKIRHKRDIERARNVANSNQELVRVKRADVAQKRNFLNTRANSEPELLRQKRSKRSLGVGVPVERIDLASVNDEPALMRQKRRMKRSLSPENVQRATKIEKNRAKRAALDRHVRKLKDVNAGSRAVDVQSVLESRKKRNAERQPQSLELHRMKRSAEKIRQRLDTQKIVNKRSINLDEVEDNGKRQSRFVHDRDYERRVKSFEERELSRKKRDHFRR